MPGFNVIRNDRNRNGGGVALYINKDAGYQDRIELRSNLFESIWASISSPQGNVFIGVMYVNPNLSATDSDLCITYLEETFDNIKAINPQAIILLGDLSIDIWGGSDMLF
jgi:hypothetical protein